MLAGMAGKRWRLWVMECHGSGRLTRPAVWVRSCGIDAIQPIGATDSAIKEQAAFRGGTGQAGGRYRLPLRNGAAIGGDDEHDSRVTRCDRNTGDASIITPTGRRQPVRAANWCGFAIVTPCGMLGRFDPLRIVWHASGQAGYGSAPSKRPPIATHI